MIQKFCYHGNVTSHFFSLLYDANWQTDINLNVIDLLAVYFHPNKLKKYLYVIGGIKIILGKLILSTKQLLSSIASFSFSLLKNRSR